MKAKKKPLSERCTICISIIITIAVIGSIFFLNRKNTSVMAEWTRPNLCYNESCIYIQTASSYYKREQGLMYRRSLDENKGLLLDFGQPGIYSVVMRNVLIPLDMIWLDENYTILYIKNMALPCADDPCPVFSAPISAKYILEINGGLAEKMNLQVGNTFTFNK